MPIYPGDRVPDDVKVKKEAYEARQRLLHAASTRIAELVRDNFELIHLNIPITPIRVKIPNGKPMVFKYTPCDIYERDAWVLWERRYEDTYSTDADPADRIVTRKEGLLVTPQQHIISTLYNEAFYDPDLRDVSSPEGAKTLRHFLDQCETYPRAIDPTTPEQTVASIEARVYGIDRDDS